MDARLLTADTARTARALKEFAVVWLLVAFVAFVLLALPYVAFAGEPMIVAHRGASFDAPENTMAAFRLGVEQGADAIEGDFYLTADGQIVCFHDRTAQRTAGVDRPVTAMTLAELQQLDVGTWKSNAFAGERPPTLDEVLDYLPAGKTFLIEIKSGPEIVPALKKSLDARRGRWADLRIISFHDAVIAAVKKELPEIKAYWLVDFKAKKGKPAITSDAIFATLARTQADGLDAQADPARLTPAFIAQLKSKGYELHVWTVDDVDLARLLLSRGVQSVTTNKPAFLRQGLTQTAAQ